MSSTPFVTLIFIDSYRFLFDSVYPSTWISLPQSENFETIISKQTLYSAENLYQFRLSMIKCSDFPKKTQHKHTWDCIQMLIWMSALRTAHILSLSLKRAEVVKLKFCTTFLNNTELYMKFGNLNEIDMKRVCACERDSEHPISISSDINFESLLWKRLKSNESLCHPVQWHTHTLKI